MKEQQERARASVVKGGSMGMQNETLAGIVEPSTFDYENEVLDSTLSVIITDNERLRSGFRRSSSSRFCSNTILC